MGKLKDLKGQTFGRLTVLSFTEVNKNHKAVWLCRCSCGTEAQILSGSLVNGATESCGCKALDVRTTHGQTYTPEYRVWKGIKMRCYYKKARYYPIYGGRGIKVCKRWLNSFENFISDMGQRPSEKHTIERLNNDGDYTPGNCVWGTTKQQDRNKRCNVKIKTPWGILTLVEAAEKADLPVHMLYSRRFRGWPASKLLLPKQQGVYLRNRI